MITIGDVDYPLEPIMSYNEWRRVNAITIQSGAIPQRYFNRQDDVGIWPIPQDAYTATVVNAIRADGMTFADYSTGTVTVTNGDATVEGASSPAWVAGGIKPGQWLTLTDSNGESRGGWYQILSITDLDTLELNRTFVGTTEATATYKIGESPELPDDGHEILAHGALADYFLEKRQSPSKAKVWTNMYWTGDPAVGRNTASNAKKPWTGGLVRMMNKYTDRYESQLSRRVKQRDSRSKLFATTISV